jgi:hypothetical protein
MKRLLIRILGPKDARAILRLSVKHRIYCVYFCLSFCMLGIGDDSPIWVIALVAANFVNAARLLKKIPLE